MRVDKKEDPTLKEILKTLRMIHEDMHEGAKQLDCLINQNKGELMASLQEVKDAIAEEKAQVVTKLTELNAEVQALKDQIASGSPVTAADLDELKASINDIFVA